MRASFVFSEVLTGLRRNVTMTIAMILTTAISLTMLGGGLLIVRLVDKMQSDYNSKIEVSLFLTDDVSGGDANCSQALCAGLRSDLEKHPGVEAVTYENRDAAVERFKRVFAAQPQLLKLVRPQGIPASLQIKLKDSSRSDVVVKDFTGKPGVKDVSDQGEFLQRLFGVFNGLRNFTFAFAVIMAVAALLLISNMIQISAYTRRTEVSIMRLVGATRWYTQLPFLLEAVVAGLIGAILAVIGLFAIKGMFIDDVLADPIQAGIVPALTGWDILTVAAPFLLLISIAISAITGYVTLRLYVRQ
jgi:cell division transport system permease protein